MPLDDAEMVYSLIVMLLIGGFVLAYPITKRLGRFLEEWITLRKSSLPEQEALTRIESAFGGMQTQIGSLEQRVDLISERQEFTESLLQRRDPVLPPSIDD
jgi:hypothetical protein